MAAYAYRADNALAGPRTPWGAIWAGVFSFVAIWSVFELLGAAIFSSAGSLAAGSPGAVGMGIWSIVLTVIAMYAGGRVTAHLGQITNRAEGIICGMTMFGLAVISGAVLVILREAAMRIGILSVHATPVSPEVEWFGFVALLLGWLCAMAGASTVRRVEGQAGTVREMRTAA